MLGETQIAAPSQAPAQGLTETFRLDLASLVFDCTNFDTFIHTDNHIQLAECGRAKSMRTDLRIVGLALLVSVDFEVPLFWKVYPSNQHASATLAQAWQELTRRCRALAHDWQSITLVFDEGNDSVRNQEVLDRSPFHLVG